MYLQVLQAQQKFKKSGRLLGGLEKACGREGKKQIGWWYKRYWTSYLSVYVYNLYVSWSLKDTTLFLLPVVNNQPESIVWFTFSL